MTVAPPVAFALSPVAVAYLAQVRHRPGMYIGRTDIHGLHRCAFQFVLLAVDGFVDGDCTRIEVTLNNDGSITISDNGPGLPTEVDTQSGLALATWMLTYPVDHRSLSRNGIEQFPVSSATALSRKMELRIVRDGFLWAQDFVDGGSPTAALARQAEQAGQGTSLRFWPDLSMFEGSIDQAAPFYIGRMQGDMRKLACYYPGLECVVRDARVQALPSNKEVRFFADSPLASLDLAAAEQGAALAPAVLINETLDANLQTLGICIAARPHASQEHAVVAFVNDEYTCGSPYRPWAGSHETGFTNGLLSALNQYALSNDLLIHPFLGKDVLPGTTAYVNVRCPHPALNNQHSLENPDVQIAVQTLVHQRMLDAFDQDPALAMAWLGNAARAARRRLVDDAPT